MLRRQEVTYISSIFTVHARVPAVAVLSAKAKPPSWRIADYVSVYCRFSVFYQVFYCLSCESVYRKSTSEWTSF